MRNKLLVSASALALLALTGCSSEPEPTATTPDSCLQALEDADNLLLLASEALLVSDDYRQLLGPVLQAGYDRDPSAMQDATDTLTQIDEDMSSLTDPISQARQAYDTSYDQCQSESNN